MFVIFYKHKSFAHWRAWEVTFLLKERAELKREELALRRGWYTSTVKPVNLER